MELLGNLPPSWKHVVVKWTKPGEWIQLACVSHEVLVSYLPADKYKVFEGVESLQVKQFGTKKRFVPEGATLPRPALCLYLELQS